MPGCSAIQRNHWPPSLTTVVPASTRAHSRLVSPAAEPAHDLQAGVQRPTVRRGLDRHDKGRVAAPTAPGAFAGALAADIGVVDLDPRSAGAKLIAAVAFDHRLHQLVLDPPGGIGRNPEPPAQLDVGQALLALGQQMHGAEPHPHRQFGALEDGAGDQRCLVAAVPALQQLTVADLTILCRCASRTLEALRPTPSKPCRPAGLLVRIEPLEGIIREALLVLHAVARHRLDPENLRDSRMIIPHPAECRW